MNTPTNMSQVQFQKLMNLMAVSTMDDSEKEAWLQMLPHMEEDEIQSLITNLSEEVEKLTDLYLVLLSQKI